MPNYLVILITAIGANEKNTFDVSLSRWIYIVEHSLFYAFSENKNLKYKLKKVGDYAHVRFESDSPIEYWRERFDYMYGYGAECGWMKEDITINEEKEELYIWFKQITISD